MNVKYDQTSAHCRYWYSQLIVVTRQGQTHYPHKDRHNGSSESSCLVGVVYNQPMRNRHFTA